MYIIHLSICIVINFTYINRYKPLIIITLKKNTESSNELSLLSITGQRLSSGRI